VSELLNHIFEDSSFRDKLVAAEKRIFDDLHQALLMDNGVAGLLE
jgi:hypothetical protein